MKDLVTAIQTRLRAELAYMRDADIYITPDLDLIPSAAGRPCIGIKDGRIAKRELAGDVIEYDMPVSIVTYQRIMQNEASVIGDASGTYRGVLEIDADIDAALDNWQPAAAYIRFGWSDGSAPSETVADGTQALVRKTRNFFFQKQEDR